MERLARARLEHLLSRAANLQKLDGNPLGVEVRRFEHVTAVMLAGEPRPLPNLVIGLAPGDEPLVRDILNWYRSRRVRCELEIAPSADHTDLLRHLAALRLYQCSFATVLYGVPQAEAAPVFGGVRVAELPPDEFAARVVEIDGVPDSERDLWTRIRTAEFSADWRRYVAFVDGAPAGHAAMWISDGAAVGTLAALPDSQWKQRPAEGEWSLTEIVCHWRDVESEVHWPRLRAVTGSDNPSIIGVDSDPWAAERDYQSQSGPGALQNFIAARKQSYSFLASQPASVWSRPARHSMLGPTHLAEIVGWILDHDRIHLEQLRRTRERTGV